MSVIALPRDPRVHRCVVNEVHVDLRQLRNWDTTQGSAAAMGALAKLQSGLEAHGLSERSSARIASALARYAFLTEGGCDLSRRLMWRMNAVDGVPADVLAPLTWDQVRLRLREIAVPAGSTTRYFSLSDQTCRLLMAARNDRLGSTETAHVFVTDRGQPWRPDSLAQVLAAISVR